MDLKERLAQFRAEEQRLSWEGTFLEYFNIVKERPEVAGLAHARVHDMIMSAGVSHDEKDRKVYDFFKNDIFGVEKPLEQLVEYFNSAAKRLEVRKRILLLMGPVGGGKSTIVALMKRGLEKYSRSEQGAIYAIKGCPMHEEPLHLIPHELREEISKEFGIYIEGDLCPVCRQMLKDQYGGRMEDVIVQRIAFSEKNRIGIGTFTPSDPKSQDISELTGSVNLVTQLRSRRAAGGHEQYGKRISAPEGDHPVSITLADIQAARARTAPLALVTPLLEDPSGGGLLLKAEHLQRTGSFKLRGAANCVMRAVEAGARHVVTGSSGNHGQAVAYVARHLGVKATIVVPEDAAAVKVRAMQSFGATVEFCGLTSNERLARAAELVRTEGAVFIPPYDHPDVMAGQGTAGLELLEQARELEAVYVPMGGGGLISGIATAVKESNPRVRVIGVEPELAQDQYLSRQAGQIVDIGVSRTIADGLRTSHPGTLTFPVIQRYVDEIVLVSEAEIRAAARYLLTVRKQAVEPSGAVSVAAALRAGGGRVAALVSGGNLDLDDLRGVSAWEA